MPTAHVPAYCFRCAAGRWLSGLMLIGLLSSTTAAQEPTDHLADVRASIAGLEAQLTSATESVDAIQVNRKKLERTAASIVADAVVLTRVEEIDQMTGAGITFRSLETLLDVANHAVDQHIVQCEVTDSIAQMGRMASGLDATSKDTVSQLDISPTSIKNSLLAAQNRIFTIRANCGRVAGLLPQSPEPEAAATVAVLQHTLNELQASCDSISSSITDTKDEIAKRVLSLNVLSQNLSRLVVECVNAILALRQRHRNESVTVAALRNIGSAEATPALSALSQSEDLSVRVAALMALAEMNSEDVVTVLADVAMTPNADNFTRLAALQRLHDLAAQARDGGDEESRKFLGDLLQERMLQLNGVNDASGLIRVGLLQAIKTLSAENVDEP